MPDSIYHQKHGEFKQFIQRLDKNLSVRDVIGTWREYKNLSAEFKHLTIQRLTDNPKLIEGLYNALHEGMGPEAKFQLPYNKEERKQQLIENISEVYSINKHAAEAKIITDHWADENYGLSFNYCLEVAIAPRTDIGLSHAGQIEILGNINDSQSVDDGANYFDGHYIWYRKGGPVSATGLRGILHECGYNTSSYVSDAKKRVPAVLYINLLTPCPEWLGGAGKTHIDTRPYADNIAKTVSSLAYKMPSYYGQGYGWSHESYGGEKEYCATDYLRDFLRDRKKAVEADPSLKYRDPLTQSGVWYRIRPIMIEGGFIPKKDWGKTRKSVTGDIDKECKELFKGLEREDLGIYAKARGMMLYNGIVYPIDFKTFEALGNKGVFILVIEKEGIADVLKDVARDAGVALVHTGGKFTKYVKALIESAKSPIAMLTDYDYDGIKMCYETLSETARVGIDKDIVDWLQKNEYPIRLEDVEEAYTPRITPEDEYLQHHRIELDSIIAAFPDNPGRGPEALWGYVKYKIEELQNERGFDYNNVIEAPEVETLYPDVLKRLLSKFQDYLEKITEEEKDKIFEEQEAVKQLISIEERETENSSRLENIIAQDCDMQERIVPIIEKANEELSKVLDGDTP